MATITLSAQKQTTFTAPIEGRDSSNLVEGLTIRRTNLPEDISGDGSRVVTIKSLNIKPSGNIGTAYGLFVESPSNETVGTTTDTVYTSYISAIASAGAGTVSKSYGLAVERPQIGGNVSILSMGDLQIGEDTGAPPTTSLVTKSATFNIANNTTEFINLGGDATELNIGYTGLDQTHSLNLGVAPIYTGAKIINIGTGGVSGSATSINLGSATSETTVDIFGTVSSGEWNGTIISPAYGGTGINNDGRTLTISNDNIALNAAVGGSTLSLPASGTVVTEDGVAELTNKTLDIGDGATNVLRIPFQSAPSGFTFAAVNSMTDSDGVLATKSYVDAVRTGLDVKESVRAATTTNLASLSGTQILDTISVSTGNRVLVKNQTDHTQNGIYIVDSAGAWTRADDFCSAQFTATVTQNSRTVTATLTAGKLVVGQHVAGAGIQLDTHIATISGGPTNYTITITKEPTSTNTNEYFSTNISSGAFVFVEEGSTGSGGNNDSGFVLNTASTYGSGYLFVDTVTTYPDPSGTPITKSPDNIDFSRFSAAGSYSAASGGGLVLTDLAFSIDADHVETLDWIKTSTADNFHHALDAATGGAANYTGWSSGSSVVFNDGPTIYNSIIAGSSSFDLVNGNLTTLNIGNWSQGVVFAEYAQILNIGTGNTTKNINIGTGHGPGVLSSVSIGSTSGPTVLNLDVGTISSVNATINMFTENTLGAFSLATGTLLQTLDFGSHVRFFNLGHGGVSDNQYVNMFSNVSAGGSYYFITGGMTSGSRDIEIGTGALGGTTNITMGSPAGGYFMFLTNDITTVSSSLNLFNTNAATLHFAGSSENLYIGDNVTTNQSIYIGNGITGLGDTKTLYIGTGSTVGTTNINIGGTIGTITLNGGTISSNNATLSLFETSDDITIGAGTGFIKLNGGNIVTDNTYLNLFDDTATTINLGGAATTINVGESTGRITMRGTTVSPSPLIRGTQTVSGTSGAYHQTGQYLLYGSTTGSATKYLTADGDTASSANIPNIPASSTWHAKVFVVVHNSTDDEGASWEITTMFRRAASGATPIALLGDPVVIAASDISQTALQVTIDADNTNMGIKVEVGGGESGKTYYWTAMVQTVEVG